MRGKPTLPSRGMDRHQSCLLRLLRVLFLAGIALRVGTYGVSTIAASEPSAATITFREHLAPVLVDRCLPCHSADKAKGGYRLDTLEKLQVPGDSGRTPIVRGNPDGSFLYRLLTTEDVDDRMPQDGEALDAATLEQFRRWIAEGASFEGAEPATSLASMVAGFNEVPAPAHYAFPVPIRAMSFTGGDRLVTGGYRELIVWSPEGALVRRIDQLPERIQALALHPDGRRLFFAGGSPGRRGAAGVVNLDDDSSVPRVLHGFEDMALAVALDPEGRHLAVGGTDGKVLLVDVATGNILTRLTGHADWITDLAFSPDGRRIASASRDRTARVFEVATGEAVSAFREHTGGLTALMFVGGSSRVVTAGSDRRLRAWNPDNGKQQKASQAGEGEVTRLMDFGGRILSAWTDGRIRAHDAETLEVLQEWGPTEDRVLGLATLKNDSAPGRLAAGVHNGEVWIWDLAAEPSPKPAVRFTAVPP